MGKVFDSMQYTVGFLRHKGVERFMWHSRSVVFRRLHAISTSIQALFSRCPTKGCTFKHERPEGLCYLNITIFDSRTEKLFMSTHILASKRSNISSWHSCICNLGLACRQQCQKIPISAKVQIKSFHISSVYWLIGVRGRNPVFAG